VGYHDTFLVSFTVTDGGFS